MTRIEAMTKLNKVVDDLTDEQIASVAEFAASVAMLADYQLSAETKLSINRSIDDFKHGRSLSLDEAEARTIAFLAARSSA